MNLTPLRQFIRLSRPHLLVPSVMQYLLGIGIARYLGTPLDLDMVINGMLWIVALQLAVHYLYEYFKVPANPAITNPPPDVSTILGAGEEMLPRSTALLSGATMLTAVALLAFGFISTGQLNMALGLFMLLMFVGGLAIVVPPFRLANSGYGELTAAILISNFIPAFALLLVSGDLNRLLAMTTFPLTLLFLAAVLVMAFPLYGRDLKYERHNLLMNIGWENGMLFHNLFILSAFVLLGVASFLGLPSPIALPGFIPLPLGLLQIWFMRRIASGVKPNWRWLQISAVLLFISMNYFLAFAFWTR
ncbi:MAG: prenyltransferase [Anaerolineales bacterium]|nr:prenyltransferase [Anaerolineales bacterium]